MRTTQRRKIEPARVIIGAVLLLVGLICLLPLIHIVAMSMSSSTAISTDTILLWPKDFTLAAYKYSLSGGGFVNALLVSVERTVLSCTLTLLLNVLAAYPLSRSKEEFPARTFYSWMYVITMFVSGGLVPTYMVIYETGLMNTIWALVLPGCASAFNALLILNFFRSLPKELGEAAAIDGAGHWRTLFSIYVPLSVTILATTTLFNFVGAWNAWFDGMIYMNDSANYPLQTYLQSLLVDTNTYFLYSGSIENIEMLNDSNIKAAQVVLTSIPIIALYPFLQKYFTKGITVGSVKG